MRIVIIDDEKNAVESLSTILEKFCTEVEIVGKAYNATSGIEIINNTHPDVAFVDIEMPDANGFDVVNSLKHTKTFMVFVTAFDQYAIRAFKSNVVGYLLKPVDIEEVQNLVEKVKEMVRNRNLLEVTSDKKNMVEKLSIPTTKGLLFVEPEKIIFIEADGRYSKIFLEDHDTVLVSKNLGEIEELLNMETFFRAHHSSIVNIKHVTELNSKDGGYLVMTGGSKVLLARRKKDDFLKLFKK